ncbi:dihydrofolate reductase family protein [Candidatus Solirubrobacter pratensis]|uniref:dihydrofolate reductase family protein n=1 Tax=Candidatus Solirubrobacter pratensis TaxID=1298857 RepID=UPI000419DCF0|nr:dihydrofolate reductase family protein [Candidatus Solirubrobacter pratensis]
MYERLRPPGLPVAAEDLLREARLGDLAGDARPYLFMNFVESADGRATREGSSRELGSEADLEMLLALRTIADAVLVGPGTIRVEGYGRLVGNPQRRERRIAAGQVADPPLVLFSRSFDVPWEAAVFDASEQPVLIYTAVYGEAPDVPAPVEVVTLDPYSSAAALADLRRRGVRALLSEGGPTLFRGLLDQGLVDELFLTLSPELVGGEERRVIGGPPLGAPVALGLQWTLQAGDELFLRYRIGPAS